MFTVLKEIDLTKLPKEASFCVSGHSNIFGGMSPILTCCEYEDISNLINSYKTVKYGIDDSGELVVDGITTNNKVDIFSIRTVSKPRKVNPKISREKLDAITEKLGSLFV